MADLTPDQRTEAEALMARLQDDDIQQRLKTGFERDFSNSVLEQWQDRHWLSFEGRNGKKSQIELIREIVGRAEDRAAGRSEWQDRRRYSGRRYEGYHRG